MAGGISEPFIRHPIATSLLMVGILFVGIIAYPRLPVAPLPQVDFPTIQVSAQLPGASPDTMASAVAQPLETQFAQISGVSQMTSTSTLGSTAITIQFNLDRDIDAASTDVQAAINAASGQLPKNLPSPPTYRKVNPADSPILLLAATSELLPLTEVDDNVETKLAQQISQVPGVAQVSVGGQQKPAIRIQLDPAKLVAKGLSLEDVRTPLSVTTVDEPKGAIDSGARSFTIYTNDQLVRSKDWNDVIVAYRNGAPLRVSDIGQAVTGPQDTKQAAWADGKRSVFLVIFKQPGANVIDDREQDHGRAAAHQGLDAAVDRHLHVERPHADDPRLRARRAVHAAAHRRARGDGDLHLSAQSMGDDHPERRGAAGAARRLRADVGRRLQSRQSVADGADDFGRLCRRRRDRDAREHHPLHRRGRGAVRGRAERLARNRLHHRVDQRFADCGVDSAAADGRHHRAAVPRIRGDAVDDDRRVGRGVADADADDGLALLDRGEGRPSWAALCPERARFCGIAEGL